MRNLILAALALPLILVACDRKSETKSPGHSMPTAAPGADKAIDPVCKMPVDKATSAKVTHDAADYYFCSDECVKKFKADAKKYAVHCACVKTSKKCDCGHCAPKGETCDCN
jgi:YHS domain-containing protein